MYSVKWDDFEGEEVEFVALIRLRGPKALRYPGRVLHFISVFISPSCDIQVEKVDRCELWGELCACESTQFSCCQQTKRGNEFTMYLKLGNMFCESRNEA